MKYRYILLFIFCLLTTTGSMAMKPVHDYIMKPDTLGIVYDELQLTTPDNYKINTWVLHPEKKQDRKKVMILAYGDAMNMSYWLEQSAVFVQAGYTVITFDYRGFGHSSAFSLDSNRLYYTEFTTDLESVVAYARNELKGYKVGIRGMSMGTIIGTLVCAKTKVDYFIGDSFVSDPRAVQDNLVKAKNFRVSLPDEAGGYKAILQSMKTPLLIFSGTQDQVTPLVQAKAVVAGHANRKLITYKGGHLEAIYILSAKVFGDKYLAAISEFLKGAK